MYRVFYLIEIMTQFLPPSLPHVWEKYFRRGKKIPKGFYRITMKAMIQDSEWKILLLKEGRWEDPTSVHYKERWGMYDLPGWGLDWWEGFREGLLREIEEEIWLEREDIDIEQMPEYVYITEVDDGRWGDFDTDDFYPVCVYVYRVRLTHYDLDFDHFPKYTNFIWVAPEDFPSYPIYSHSARLGEIISGRSALL
jgi:8-oxo-dGTP pyrophosphatase MutT (NUDIX family)